MYKYASARGFEFIYIPVHNTTTVEEVLKEYNTICDEMNIGPTDTLILAGQSMGGLLVSRLVTRAYYVQLKRPPDAVRLFNPVSGGTDLSRSEVALANLSSYRLALKCRRTGCFQDPYHSLRRV